MATAVESNRQHPGFPCVERLITLGVFWLFRPPGELYVGGRRQLQQNRTPVTCHLRMQSDIDAASMSSVSLVFFMGLRHGTPQQS